MKSISKVIVCITVAVITFASCEKSGYITSDTAGLTVADSVKFDTMFTSVGSITKSFTIINTNNRKLKLDAIRLMGGSQSPYKINVDGIPGSVVENVDIEAGDSLFVFVSVTIDPNATTTPFLIKDSIEYSFNGINRYTQLEAYGQNAVFLANHVVTGNTLWQNDLPYVISGGLYISPDATLTIDKGANIYFHADAPILVYGTLKVNGTAEERVSFQGDRLDRGYRNLPSSWPGIIFNENSTNNVLNYALIKNAYQAVIAVGGVADVQPQLTINQCIIDNAYDTGIRGLQASIDATNCLITNCGANVHLAGGGKYNFTHCTIAGYNTVYINHLNPLVYASTSYPNVVDAALQTNFTNCIIWGEGVVQDEIQLDHQGNVAYDVTIDHTLYGNQQQQLNASLVSSIMNVNPVFDSVDQTRRYFDFRLKPSSPAVGVGKATLVNVDLDGKTRTGTPDLGCYTR